MTILLFFMVLHVKAKIMGHVLKKFNGKLMVNIKQFVIHYLFTVQLLNLII